VAQRKHGAFGANTDTKLADTTNATDNNGIWWQWRTQEFWLRGWGGVQQIQLRTEDRGNGDLGAVVH